MIRASWRLPRTAGPALLIAALLGAPAAGAGPEQSCMDCHGKDGVSVESDVPTIAGVSEAYLSDVMAYYRDKSWPCPESKYRAGDKSRAPTDMCRIASGLSAADTTRVVAFFSSKPFVAATQAADPAQAATGKKLHQLHCEKCHSDGGRSAEDDSGILAGQWMPYLRVAMKEYIQGKREMPEKMRVKVEKLGAGDVEALVQYYGSQK